MKFKLHWIMAIVMLVLVTGCINGKLQIQETSTHVLAAYTAGKGTGLGINKVVPIADKELGEAWDKMMARNKDNAIVAGEEVILYYAESIGIIGSHIGDPYGLIQDLGVVLGLFGAQFDSDGNLVGLGPVPKTVLEYFAMGYRNGKRVALKE